MPGGRRFSRFSERRMKCYRHPGSHSTPEHKNSLKPLFIHALTTIAFPESGFNTAST